MAKDEDIFKKLNKQTPLVKQKELQPLSSKDFTLSRNTINVPVGSPDKKRIKKENKRNEPEIFSKENDRAPESRPAAKSDASYGAIHGRKQKSYDRVSKQGPRPEKREEEPKLNVFSDRSKARKTSETRPFMNEDAESISVSPEKAGGFSLRHELKYYINYRDYVLLRSCLKSLMSPDPFAGDDNTYHVRSLYFDDINDSALREKIAGSDNRRKYRIRIYNHQDRPIRFEKKYKAGQHIGKKSIDLSRDEYENIITGEYGFLLGRKEELAKELYLEIKGGFLRPRVIVDYMREAYVSPFENCRITFDKDLKASIMLKDIFDTNAPVMPMYEDGIMVLEVKFNKYLPEFIKRVLNNINAADRCAISKYVICRKYD